MQVSGDDVESNEFRKVAVQVFNANVFNQINSSSLNVVSRPTNEPALRTTDKKLIGDLAGWAHYIKNTRIGINQYENKMLEQGEKLIQQIQKEYDLNE